MLSYLVANLSLTGFARLFFEPSGNLQSPLIGKTMVLEREKATYCEPHDLFFLNISLV